ncbi:MAG TPA: DUF3072 domain-containing protein [Burkholderiales bacterium]|nr:DUF3072 domain-containing protein [Burkholderiales bacterium]
MTDKQTQEQAGRSNMEKDPDTWTTGDEPMTGAQRSYLKTLCEEAKVDFDETLTKAEASKRIDELQHITGRGVEGDEQSGARHDLKGSRGRNA